MDVADLRIKFSADGVQSTVGDINRVNTSLGGVEDHSKRANSAFSSMFAVAGGFIGAQVATNIAGWAGGILMASANAEQAHISLETVVGSAEKANQIFDDVQAFAASTPFEFPELIQSVQNLEAFGLKSEEWLPIIGDTASAMGKSVDQVTQAVLDASSGQYERLKELGIMAGVEGDKLVFRYFKDGQQIVETVDKNNQELIQSTIGAIWSDKYAGAMERQSQTFLGRWSTLKDNINTRLVEMSDGVFDFATKSLGFVNDIFTDGFGDAVRNLGIDFSIGGVISLAGDLLDAAGDLWGWIKRKLFGSIGSGDGTGPVGDMAQIGLGSIALDAVLNLAGDLLALRDDAASWIKTAINWVGDKTIDVGRLTINAAIELNYTLTTVNDAGKSLVQKVMDGVRNSGDEIRAANVWLVGHFFGAFGFAVGAMAGGIATAAGAIIGALITAIQDPMAIVDAVNKVGDVFDKIISQGLDLAIETGAAAFEGFWTNFKQGFELAVPVDISDAIVTPLADALNPGMWVDTAAMVAEWLWDSVAQKLVDLAPSSLGIKDKLKDILGIEDPNESIGDPAGGGAINQLVGNFDFSGLETKVSGFADKYATYLEGVKSSTATNMTAAADALLAQTARMQSQAMAHVQSMQQGVAQSLSALPGIFGMYANNAVSTFVSALWRGVAEAQVAATAMAAAVDLAVASRLQIHSPSAVMDAHGLNTVNPFLDRLEWGAGRAGSIMSGMGLPRGAGGFSGARSGGNAFCTVYYDLRGSIIGGDVDRWISDKIANGQGKRIDRRITSSRIQESH